MRIAGVQTSPARLLSPASLTGPVWVVAPHPDDESLGCGGLMAELSALGREVWALLLTDGGASHPGSAKWPRRRLAAERLGEWHAALDLLGVDPARRVALDLPDGALPRPDGPDGSAAVQGIRAALSAAPPATLLLPWRRDPHPDHRAGHALLLAAVGGLPEVRLLEYTVWLPERGAAQDQPRPGEAQLWRVAVGQHAPRKAAAIRAHHSQLGELIDDDPGGFVLPGAMIERALDGDEWVLEVLPEALLAASSAADAVPS